MPATAAAASGVASTDEERMSLLTAAAPTTHSPVRGVKDAEEHHCWRKPRTKPVVAAMVSLVIALTSCLLIFYWSTTGRNNHSSTTETSFGQLATPMVWNAHVESLRAVENVFTASMVPEQANVAVARKLLLKTRNLLDVFAPVYPVAPTTSGNFNQINHQKKKKLSSKHHNKKTADWWLRVRLQYKKGYEIVGAFIDLSHAHIVLYDNTTCDHRRQKVLDWKADFLDFCNNNNDDNGELLDEYLRRPLTSRRQRTVRHSHESKFFWKHVPTTTFWPSSAAAPTLNILVAHQLRLAQTFLGGTLSLEQQPTQQPTGGGGNESSSIIHNHTRAETLATHETFHNLRKTLRALCDEYERFGPLLLPTTSAEPIQNGTTSVAVKPQNGTTTTTTPAAAVAVKCLVEARTLLGDLNDDFTAYLFYVQHKQYRDQVAALVEQIDQKLEAFCEWTTQVDFAAQLDLLLLRATAT